jgi:hypothetical protein
MEEVTMEAHRDLISCGVMNAFNQEQEVQSDVQFNCKVMPRYALVDSLFNSCRVQAQVASVQVLVRMTLHCIAIHFITLRVAG